MKPEDQRIALAKWAGKDLPRSTWAFKYNCITSRGYATAEAAEAEAQVVQQTLDCRVGPVFLEARVPGVDELPDIADLNVLHEYEKRLTIEEKGTYHDRLNAICAWEKDGMKGQWAVTTATAAQRAEAILRTLSLWKEGEPQTINQESKANA